ncbi:N-6 DNA methylase [Streptomyces sp. NPDC007988]|uniref:HsdM family class I SAM-dependent methyltransferase n=1 Tax=Streptomyces sp. NPDC007988 TaxID=3364802 RepID=UPI0036E3A772
MSSEAIRDAFTAVGYQFVQLEPKLAGIKERWRPDVVAWAADASGTLVPWAVVETKQAREPIHPASGLSALARARDLLGTVDHYVVVNEAEWYRADAGLQRLVKVDGPEPPPNGGEGEIADADLLTSLLTEDLWRAASRVRDRGHSVIDFVFSPQLTSNFTGFRTSTGTWIRASRKALWQARRNAVVEFARRGREAGEFTSHRGIAKAVAQLAGNKLTSDLLDPFCGTGSFLWEAIDYAQEHDTGLSTVLAYDMNQRMVDLVRSIGEVAPVPVEIVQGDAFQADLSLTSCVVTAPPLGLRLDKPHDLLDGSMTKDADLVAIDRIVRVLDDGGRAVIQVPAGVTFRSSGEGYRRYLANRFRVAALIGCPPGVVPGTGVRSVLLVIENAEPTDTFVAQLGEDWEAQLAPGGAALEAALAHIDGGRS